MDRPRPHFVNTVIAALAALLQGVNRNPMAQRGARHQLHTLTRKSRVRVKRSADKVRAWKKRRRQIAKASRRLNRQRAQR